jgi:hypothetical protein
VVWVGCYKERQRTSFGGGCGLMRLTLAVAKNSVANGTEVRDYCTACFASLALVVYFCILFMFSGFML